MGIPGFQKWLSDTFPASVDVKPITVRDGYNHVAFDMNQMCHLAARRSSNMDTLVRLLFRDIDNTLKVCIPKRSIFFAFDGPAPLAKLLTQRKRRAKETCRPPRLVSKAKTSRTRVTQAQDHVSDSSDTSSRISKKRTSKRSSLSDLASKLAIDRVALTPGIQLMHDIAAAVEYYAYSRLQRNARFRYVEIRISGPDVPGEGELKIFDWLSTFVAARSPSLPVKDTVAVVGSDADIVLQALATVKVQNIFIFVRNAKSAGKRTIGTYTIISVWEINRQLHHLFPHNSLAVRLDFIILSIMNGNDYIPKLRGSSLGRLWKRYLALRSSRESDSRPTDAVIAEDVNSSGTKASDPSSSAARGLFGTQTLIDPHTRTFNWPFLCALLRDSATSVPDITARKIVESKLSTARSRLLQRVASETNEAEAKDSDLPTGDQSSAPFVQDPNASISDANRDSSADCPAETKDTLSADVGCEDLDDLDDEFSDNEDGDDDINDDLETADDCPDVDDEFADMRLENLEEYEDVNSAHIENLIAITGSVGTFFDTEQWLRTLLYTLQMYVDGYCSDFTYTYSKPYAPSAKAILAYIESHDGDPYPQIQAPVSAEPALSPLKAGFAMLPRKAAQYLPVPLQEILSDQSKADKIFLAGHNVCLQELHDAVDRIPPSAFSPEERKRTRCGRVLLLRNPTERDMKPRENPTFPMLSDKFVPINARLILVRREVDSTSAPPCLPWPNGAIYAMLNLPYKRGHGCGTANTDIWDRLGRQRFVGQQASPSFSTASPRAANRASELPRRDFSRMASRQQPRFGENRGAMSPRGSERGFSRGSRRGSTRGRFHSGRDIDGL